MRPRSILGIDTATAVAAVGVVSEGRIAAEVFEFSGEGHAPRLADLARRALDDAGMSLAELDSIAVSIGPGSFTGIRVGLGFAKGIAYSAGLPLVGVGTLEALARVAPGGFPRIAAVTDARKGEVYLGSFRRRPGGVERVGEDAVLTPEAAAELIRSSFAAERGVVVGDAAERYPELFRPLAASAIELVSFREVHPRGSMVADLGAATLERGGESRAERVSPRYLRPSAAEVNLERSRAEVAR
ncbi:MAG: tRNA (adenosine(37)-N6)-threonylcarbamoyltransferase complex dimerization subunit type 1 TsaB [Candidatus Binatia bacterium]